MANLLGMCKYTNFSVVQIYLTCRPIIIKMEIWAPGNKNFFLHCLGGSKFRLTTGAAYVYEYQADTVTITGTSNETSEIKLSAEAHLHILSPCEISLQV